MMGMMLHMQEKILAASLKDSSSCKSGNNLHKSFTNLQNLDDTFNHILAESLKLSQSGSVDVSEMRCVFFVLSVERSIHLEQWIHPKF
eukprot:14758159-Ditylum_brightwellii.AAC.1